jgi:hypothetical protein
MTEVAEASKDALSYQIKSGPALAKQVAYAQSLGVNFGDVAKAGKNMAKSTSELSEAAVGLGDLVVDPIAEKLEERSGNTKPHINSAEKAIANLNATTGKSLRNVTAKLQKKSGKFGSSLGRFKNTVKRMFSS